MSTSKIRIKLGAIEVDYEGSEEFLKAELPEILGAVAKLHKEIGAKLPPAGAGTHDSGGAPKKPASNGASGSIEGTTATIAAKLGCDSGPELITAAAAQLTFVGGKDEFTKKELSAACRGAKNLWKKSYRNNFNSYVSRLVSDGAFNELRTDVYALGAKKRSELESDLAES